MRVAIVSPVFGETGGPELGTIQLADALADAGIDVTLFAPADFATRARIHPILPVGLWSMPDFKEQTEQERANLIISSQFEVVCHQHEYDIVHLSSQRYAYSISRHLSVPTVLTLHNKITERDMRLIRTTPIKIVALTKKQQDISTADTFIHPGIPLSAIIPSYAPGKGLITVGRITEQKGIHRAIAIAKGAKKMLTIIGRVGDSIERQSYYQKEILPFIDGSQIRIINNLPNEELLELLRNSEALLFPIIRPETFGRVSAETLACGTPVIGSRVDPLPEILSDRATSFLSDDLEELIQAAKNTDRFDRRACRQYAERHFGARNMAKAYIELYSSVIQAHRSL